MIGAPAQSKAAQPIHRGRSHHSRIPPAYLARITAAAFLTPLIAAVPCNINTVLTDNGIQVRFPPRYGDGPTARFLTHMFDLSCREHGTEHRTRVNHAWTL